MTTKKGNERCCENENGCENGCGTEKGKITNEKEERKSNDAKSPNFPKKSRRNLPWGGKLSEKTLSRKNIRVLFLTPAKKALFCEL